MSSLYSLLTIDPVIRGICVATLAIVLMGSGAAKARKLRAFGDLMRGYALLPDPFIGTAAALITALELMAGAALLLQFSVLGAATALALCLMFAAALGINIARGNTGLDCGCSGFGAGTASDASSRISPWHVARALFLALMAAALLLPTSLRSTGWLDIWVGSAATLVTLATLLALDGLLGNEPKLKTLRT
jgi:uncharacterized membrane protein